MTTITCSDLDESIDQYTREMGYRLDMIVPADNPTAAVVSKDGEAIRLVLSSSFSWPNSDEEPTEVGTQNEWITGRAGMEYRDLIPGRLGGRMIASHIRLTKGGEVPDYVHYHKVKFQMIYCLKGSIRVVYEDQGEPFWLNPGDCVLQPPEIRHRVLECTAGSEVIEIAMPAIHETWIEHDIELPTSQIKPDRDFGGQRFLLDRASEAVWYSHDSDGFETRKTEVLDATNNLASVRMWRLSNFAAGNRIKTGAVGDVIRLYVVLKGELTLEANDKVYGRFQEGDCFTAPTNKIHLLDCSPDCELISISV